VLIFDIETDGFLDAMTRIHLLVLRDVDTNAVEVYRNNDVENTVEQGVRRLMDAATAGEGVYLVAGHNVIKFDVPAIQKFFPWFVVPQARVLDTIILGRLMYPDLKAQDGLLIKQGRLPKSLYKKHSLEAWGRRLGNFKGEYEGDPSIPDEKERKARKWERWNQAMEDYCVQDTDTTASLYRFLLSKSPAPVAVELEHQVAWILARQERYGFQFDKAAAARLYSDLASERDVQTTRLRDVFPPFFVPDGKVFTPKGGNRKNHYTPGCPVQKIKRVQFNPASRDHVALMLKRRYQWDPEEFTDDGKPKIDDAVLEKLEYPEAKVLADYYLVAKRIGQVAEGNEAWLRKLKPTGRIHHNVTTNGAVTGRMTHSTPNIAQVPKVKSGKEGVLLGLKGGYGFECRSCFVAKEGYVLVGADAAALELRDLAGYMAGWDGGAYVKVVVDGKKEDGTEIHTVNRKALEIDSRDDAKTWFYAFLYGAGDEKLGLIVVKVRGKGAAKKGAELRAKFLKNLPALGALVKAVKKKAAEQKFLLGLDGRRLHVRSQHAALNTLLQSAGAVQMKKALVILDAALQAKGYVPGVDYEFVANVHDEWQIETKREIADDVGKTAVASIRAAGEFFKFPCPLDGEYKVGRTWAETH
jgi:DNA polymerase-1